MHTLIVSSYPPCSIIIIFGIITTIKPDIIMVVLIVNSPLAVNNK